MYAAHALALSWRGLLELTAFGHARNNIPFQSLTTIATTALDYPTFASTLNLIVLITGLDQK